MPAAAVGGAHGAWGRKDRPKGSPGPPERALDVPQRTQVPNSSTLCPFQAMCDPWPTADHGHSHPVNHVTSLSDAAVALAHACQHIVEGTHKAPLNGSDALYAQMSPAS